MAIGDAFSEEQLSPNEWVRFAQLCKLPIRLVAHGPASEVSTTASEMGADMLQQGVPGEIVQRVQQLVLATAPGSASTPA